VDNIRFKFGSLQTFLDRQPYVEHLDRFKNIAESIGVLRKDYVFIIAEVFSYV